ncbi:serine/threonine protein kinase [Bifidobacterium leontopitheci]|uniref:Serine/threonine protein kinase n=1 Tax=Bifidobacterium leontopitheci TaxID=2650774 RepID=A0A6I1GF65_9BIFI|nr:serine/threonine protein kinase [Bifidobacterium leontopitheci]KAB7790283.1 serine/threonine protein kinase [Bifidobacterium leontopitheci]
MLTCPNCGALCNADDRFCVNCGSRLTVPTASPQTAGISLPPIPAPPTPAAGHADPSSRSIPTMPIPVTPTPSQPDDGGPAAAAVSLSRKRRRAVIILIAAILALALVCGGGIAVWKLELIGPRTVPAISSGKADDVAKQLEGKGFVVKRKQVFSATRKGTYMRMEGAKSGDRLDRGSQITVVESRGPGVPEGTVGMTPEKAEARLKTMGVKVVEHEVVADHPGKVSVTVPADGQPLNDPSDGIHIGVGVDGDGIPVEIAGMDKDKAKDELESRGFTVTLKPLFSSRKNLGKIVRADPGIGVMTDTDKATLYYGVDASERYNVVGESMDNTMAMTNTGALAGEYCTDDGDCITLSVGSSDAKPTGLIVDGKEPDSTWDELTLCDYSQDASGCEPVDKDGKPLLKDFLISGTTGAMELYAGMGLPNCGTSVFSGDNPYAYCENDVPREVDSSKPWRDADVTIHDRDSRESLVYKAKELFVVMPVGADLKQLETDGYFSGSSTYQPDADRPYLIRRDNEAYKDVKAYKESGDSAIQDDPYAPGPHMKRFDKAPNAGNVYYLVENPVDFSQFTETTVSGKSDGKSKSDAGGKSDKNAKGDDKQGKSSKSGSPDTYFNSTYQYSVDIPRGYTWGPEPDIGDHGRSFTSPDGTVTIDAFAYYNISFRSPQEELDFLKENLDADASVALAEVHGQSVYLSYSSGGKIVYKREIVIDDSDGATGRILSVTLTYPSDARSEGDPLTETIPLTLKDLG